MSKNILLVDNDTEIIELNKKALEAEGFIVSVANSAKEALDKLAEKKHDLIITEVMLEDSAAGFSLCHESRKKYPDTKIMILSDVVRKTGISFGLDTKDDKTWIKADEFVYKPINMPSFLCKIKKHLG